VPAALPEMEDMWAKKTVLLDFIGIKPLCGSQELKVF
jgi:hypothetical protein